MMTSQHPQDSWNDDDDDDVEDNIVVPLVEDNDSSTGMDSALRQRRQRRERLKSLEIIMRAQEESSTTTTCFGDSWRFIASVVLGSIMIAPLLLKHYRSSSSSDSLPCAHDLSISYSETFDKISNADSYCLESHPTCSCTSPFVPKAADSQKPQWNKAFERNIALAKNASMDVVLLGDSITEHWQGTSMGTLKYPEIYKVYQDLFQNKQQRGIAGLALGISGDRCPQVLYRLQNGEMPVSLTPQVWWLLIGTNDLASGACTPETVFVGIMNIVNEIKSHDDYAIVVINSILPRPQDNNSGKLDGDLWNDICWINERMQCYVEGVERTEFFNATNLFLRSNDDRYINETLMPDMLHPSAEGSRVWGTEIVQRVKELVEE